MSHDSHTDSHLHLEADAFGGRARAQAHFLALAADWEDPFDAPLLEIRPHRRGGQDIMFNVIREDILPAGSKARFGSLLLQKVSSRGPIVYVAPRFGFAGISLAWLCAHYRRRLVLFMPSCKRISAHQAVAIEHGAEARFLRIAAMPNLNRVAAAWAGRNGGTFIPLGLRHELVTAAIVRTAVDLDEQYRLNEMGGRMWTAVSTGVLSRGLQIGLPALPFHGVAVARNLKDGERGDARLSSYDLEFAQDSAVRPPFPCASNYDAKAWHHMTEDGQQGDTFWNVAGDAQPKCQETYSVDSQRDWGDDRDLCS